MEGTPEHGRGGPTLLGVPLTYIPMWAALIAALSLIPVSPLIGGGGFFTLSMAAAPAVGIALGPWAGALAAMIGGYAGAALAPYSAILGPLEPLPRAFEALVAGLLVHRRRWLALATLAVGPLLLLAFWSSFPLLGAEFPRCALPPPISGLSPYAGFLFGVTHVWPSWILLLTSFGRVRRWVSRGGFRELTASTFVVVYYSSSSAGHVLGSILALHLYRLPLSVYVYAALTVTWAERLLISLCGSLVAAAAVTAVRRVRASKPPCVVW